MEVFLAQGKLEDALRQSEELASTTARDGFDSDHAYALELQARILLRAGRPANALAIAGRALALAQRISYRALLWRIQGRRAEALAALGEHGAAVQARQAAANVITELASTIAGGDQRRRFLADAEVAAVLRAGAAPRRGRAKA